MAKTFAGALLALLAGALVACGGQSGPGPMAAGPIALAPLDGSLSVTALLPADTVGEELPREGVGTVSSAYWQANIGGFTQRDFSEVLAFPPGTKITIRNLSKTLSHTLNVVREITGPPANFPLHPSLSLQAHGGNQLQAGYASGIILPGHSVTVVLVKGIYLIGCAIHYGHGMRDVIVVEDHSHPGPQASPSPSPSPTTEPTPTPTPSTAPSLSPTPSPTASSITLIPTSVTVCSFSATCSTSHAATTAQFQAIPPGGNGPAFTINDSACSVNSGAYVSPLQGYGPFTVTAEDVVQQCNVIVTEGSFQATLTVNVVNQ